MFSLKLKTKLFRHALCISSLPRFFSSNGKLLTVEIKENVGIAILNINRPPVNALNFELLQCLSETIKNVEQNKFKGLILTSSSSSIFTAGLDVTEMYRPNKDRLEKLYTALQDFWLALYGSSLPTAAVINGHSPAGGCVFATCSDYRVMLPHFTIGLNETKLGLVAPNFVMSSFCNVLPRRPAELALTQGKMFSSLQALEIGLIDELAESKEEAINKCVKFLVDFENVSPVARALTKKQFRMPDIEQFHKNRFLNLESFVSCVMEPEFQQQLGAYIENLKNKKRS